MSRRTLIAANRANAQKSTGPKTEAGKVTSSQNSFRHGLSGSTVKMIRGENLQDFLDLGNSLIAEHRPATVTEDALVTTMAESLWMARRAINLQQELIEQNSPDKDLFRLYLRYQTTHRNAFTQALNTLMRIRKEARQRETGFVSQEATQQLQTVKIRYLTARSEKVETATRIQNERLSHSSRLAVVPPTTAKAS